MPSEDPARRLRDIIENVERIQRYTEGHKKEEFANSALIRDAVERCFQRITEARIKLGSDFMPDVFTHDFFEIRSLGNILRHEYDAVRADVLWEIINMQLPALRRECHEALTALER